MAADLKPSDLEISGPSIPLLEGTTAAVPVIDLATRLNATLVIEVLELGPHIKGLQKESCHETC